MEQIKLRYELDLEPNYIWLSPTATQAAKRSIPYVQELGVFPCRERYYTERERLPSFLIKYCISGGGLLKYDGKRYAVRSGHIFWLDCMKKQHYCTDPGEGSWFIVWVHFYGEECRRYYDLFLQQNDGMPVVDAGADESVRSSIEMLVDIYRNANGTLTDDVRAASLLTGIMSSCILYADMSARHSELPAYVQAAREYINCHYAEKISLDVLAREISVNKFYLQKIFRRSVGLSPNEYLATVRLQEAKRLLRSTDLPISQIAMDVGFGSIGHFIELFKAREQMPPSVYRRRW